MAQTATTTVPSNETTKTQRLRRFFFNEDNSNNHRRVTIVYKHDRQTKTLTYGASIYHTPRHVNDIHSIDSKSHKSEKFDKNKHYETAVKRFNEHPVVVQNFQDDGKFQDFRLSVRKLLFTHGCRFHQQTTDSSKTTNVA